MKRGALHLPLWMLLASMVIFGSIGAVRRLVPLGSATLASLRGFVGAAVILLLLLLRRRRPAFAAIRRSLWKLLLSGAMIGVNWMLLFEAYGHTTVAVATLCYYMAPVFAVCLAPLLLREKITPRRLACVGVAAVGMVGVSGVFRGDAGADVAGVLFGLAAAAFYAGVILLNQRISGVPALEKTAVQLFAAAVAVLPYALVTESVPEEFFAPVPILLALTMGVVHTGVAYALYFAAMPSFSAQAVALCGYVDPAVALVLSATLLGEPFGVFEAVGTVCILGATLLGEIPFSRIRARRRAGQGACENQNENPSNGKDDPI